jgi:hypothetical protein
LRSSEALTMRTGDAGLVIEDGPYAETKEQVGGLLIVDCEGLHDAIELARQDPVARIGAVEIRPIGDAWPTWSGPETRSLSAAPKMSGRS